MKVTAHRAGPSLVRLMCGSTIFRASRIVYAHWTGTEWLLSSGRKPSRAMLNAIDELPLSFDAVSR